MMFLSRSIRLAASLAGAGLVVTLGALYGLQAFGLGVLAVLAGLLIGTAASWEDKHGTVDE